MPRPRLATLIARLVDSYGFVWITATAGAGKTTAAREALVQIDGRHAWLTLDPVDGAPGRLVAYLEASLVKAIPEIGSAASDALAAGVAHPDAAALLAEATAGHPLTLVLDELESIIDGSEARITLASFLRHAPDSLRVILISRRPVALPLGSRLEIGGMGRVTERDLAFTVDEAAVALAAADRPTSDAEAAVEATGGWVAGILFEAWRSAEHVYGAGGETDALRSYLASEIMGHLTEEQRDFLIATSLLPEVTAERAEAVGQARSREIIASLAEANLPVTFSCAGARMRCHPRFREYLEELLLRRDEDEVRAARAAYGALLVTEGGDEDAVDVFLAAGAIGDAHAAAERAIHDVLRRLDFDIVARWLAGFPRTAVERSEALTVAEMLVALESEEYGRGAACADRLRRMVAERPATPLGSDLVGAIAWCYFIVDRIEDARAMLADVDDTPATRIIRFAIGAETLDDPIHYRDRPANSGESVDGLLAVIDLAHGRFGRLVQPTAQSGAAFESSRIGALRGLGRLDEVVERVADAPMKDWAGVRLYTELMADLDRPEDAWQALADGRDLLARSGSGLYRILALLLEAMLALRFSGDTVAAAAALAAVEREPTARQRIRVVEQVALWRGLLHLIEGHPAEAGNHLRQAVSVMLDWDRLLFLPMAATYLAEAEWRLENEEAADAAADIALEAARQQGSNHQLLQALRQYPAVVARRLDAEANADSAWHQIGRIMMADGLIWSAGLGPVVRLREFGEPVIEVDGELVRPKLAKSYEVLAYLAANGGSATRAELFDAIFDARNDVSARSYLRQALSRLREVLPADAPLVTTSELIRWDGAGLSSESLELQRRLQQAARLRGREALEAALDGLALAEAGEYLPNINSAWASRRREDLRDLANEVRYLAAEAAFEIGELHLAERLGKQTLAEEPYRESSWRLMMRTAGALGNGDRVIANFLACERALAGIQTSPSASTRRLLEHLRR